PAAGKLLPSAGGCGRRRVATWPKGLCRPSQSMCKKSEGGRGPASCNLRRLLLSGQLEIKAFLADAQVEIEQGPANGTVRLPQDLYQAREHGGYVVICMVENGPNSILHRNQFLAGQQESQRKHSH